MSVISDKFKEIIFSVTPIAFLILLLHLTITPLEPDLIVKFIIGALLIIVGLTIFLLGVDIGITPIGNIIGEQVAKQNKMWLILIGGLLLGFFISIAEPDLHIIAKQIEIISLETISRLMLIIVVSLGVAIFFSYGLYRIVKNISLKYTFIILYIIVFIIAFFTPRELLAIAFDTSGATTGALTVPFVLAIAIGIARLQKNTATASADSFGLVGLISIGAIITGLIYNFVNRQLIDTSALSLEENYLSFFETMTPVFIEVSLALTPVILVFIILNHFVFKITGKKFKLIMQGVFYTFFGMSLFLIGVNGGFLEVGNNIGLILSTTSIWILLLTCLFLGMTTILAEPAVYVLTKQIEEVTSGYIKRSLILAALAIGVGLAIVLAMLRIQYNLDLFNMLLIGYGVVLLLSIFVPTIFVGMAFDSGAVASGPMTATFILAFMHGLASAQSDINILAQGFGMISLVAMMPIITLQLLGLIYKIKTKKEV